MDRLLDYSINHPLLAGGLLLMTLIVIGYELRLRGAMSSAIGPGEAVRLVNSGAVLVDLRSANLFKDGHITGRRTCRATRSRPIPRRVEKLAAKTIVLYCDDGATTAAAQRTLTRAGAKDVFSLRGGLAA